MLFLLSGASASGKKTIARALGERLPNLQGYHENDLRHQWPEFASEQLTPWIDFALELESEGNDLVLGTQSPLGRVLAHPRSTELEGIAGCVLDCHDYVRLRRLERREVDPRWPIGQDHFCWAVFHRMHALDPQWEQRICRESQTEERQEHWEWARWTEWTAEDPRWDVYLLDTTNLPLEEAITTVAEWVESARSNGMALMRDNEWWR